MGKHYKATRLSPTPDGKPIFSLSYSAQGRADLFQVDPQISNEGVAGSPLFEPEVLKVYH